MIRTFVMNCFFCLFCLLFTKKDQEFTSLFPDPFCTRYFIFSRFLNCNSFSVAINRYLIWFVVHIEFLCRMEICAACLYYSKNTCLRSMNCPSLSCDLQQRLFIISFVSWKEKDRHWWRNSTAAEEVAWSSVSSLIRAGLVREGIQSPKTRSKILMDRQLTTWWWLSWIFSKMEGSLTRTRRVLTRNQKCIMEVSLKVGCLPYAVGKQPSIPMIIRERKRTSRWW